MNVPRKKFDYNTYFRQAYSVHSNFMYRLRHFSNPMSLIAEYRHQSKTKSPKPATQSTPISTQTKPIKKVSNGHSKIILMAVILACLVTSYILTNTTPATKKITTASGEVLIVQAEMSEVEIQKLVNAKPGQDVMLGPKPSTP